jgi:hypothetical protein
MQDRAGWGPQKIHLLPPSRLSYGQQQVVSAWSESNDMEGTRGNANQRNQKRAAVTAAPLVAEETDYLGRGGGQSAIGEGGGKNKSGIS